MGSLASLLAALLAASALCAVPAGAHDAYPPVDVGQPVEPPLIVDGPVAPPLIPHILHDEVQHHGHHHPPPPVPVPAPAPAKNAGAPEPEGPAPAPTNAASTAVVAPAALLGFVASAVLLL